MIAQPAAEYAFSSPIEALPAYLSTVSMVVDDRSEIVRRLTYSERKSPPVYQPARDLFCHVLEGKLTLDAALQQARCLIDTTERRCAEAVLTTSADFLRGSEVGRLGQLLEMAVELPNGMPLAIKPVWVRHLAVDRLMILHFWERSLTQRQLGAAGALLRTTLAKDAPRYLDCEIDFVSVSIPRFGRSRQFQLYNWATLNPLTDKELKRFLTLLCDAWSEYQARGPRKYKRRGEPTLPF